MNQFELAQLAKKIANLYIKPWHERDKGRLLPPLSASFANYDEVYSYIINEWIPEQPDRESLMKLFIWVNFQLEPFFKIIIQPPPGSRTNRKAS